jgi:hypothetical protein
VFRECSREASDLLRVEVLDTMNLGGGVECGAPDG